MRQRRRKTDWGVLVAFLLVMASSAYAWYMADQAIEKVEATQARVDREGVERRDQICLSAEREHLVAVQQLRRTYDYLSGLSPRQQMTPLNQALLRNLPTVERAARTDVAPLFCDEPGVEQEQLWFRTKGKDGQPPVGLPEPDPEVPTQRPAGIPPTG